LITELPLYSFEWSSADGSFEITDATEGKLLMKKQLIDVEEGLYFSDLQMTRPNTDVETYCNAEISIVEDYSRTP